MSDFDLLLAALEARPEDEPSSERQPLPDGYDPDNGPDIVWESDPVLS